MRHKNAMLYVVHALKIFPHSYSVELLFNAITSVIPSRG
jgi:hypothetical protein